MGIYIRYISELERSDPGFHRPIQSIPDLFNVPVNSHHVPATQKTSYQLLQLIDMFINSSTVFLTDLSIAALPHFFRKCHTIISPTGPKGTKKEKTHYKNNVCIYVHMPTFPYNISQNLIGYAVFRKHPSLSKTHTCENIESTVCDPLFSLMTPNFSFSMGPVEPGL